ncbi:MAG: hypothetical protein M9962_08405 [Oligoflexia bacterium]|nr:hypothetical protein [Oligoflexia bacterium]
MKKIKREKQKNKICLILAIFIFPICSFASSGFEIGGEERHHVTADRTLYHSKDKIYEAFGNVVVSAKEKRLSSDYLWYDDTTKDVRVKGNVIFVDKETSVQAAEIHFNLQSGIGSIFYGKVFNDAYTLRGQLIRKIAEDRFLTTEGEYTTCKDCSESWKISAASVDLTIEGYAFMSSVFIKIKDVPTLYLPYLIVPIKTKRQSGLLFPRIGGNTNDGFVFVQPFYWAISEHQDATLSLGRYSSRGLRYEFEHRYKTFNDSEGIINFYRTEDRKFADKGRDHRTAIKTEHIWNFHRNVKAKWRILEVRDRDYSEDFPTDINSKGLPSLESNVLAQFPFSDFFIAVEAKRYRNLLYHEPRGNDGGTVQAYPSAYFGIRERKLLGPLFFNFNGRFDNFKRRNGAFQDQNSNGIFDSATEDLRETNRIYIAPEISAPFRIGSILKISPSLQYNETRYSFPLPTINQNIESTSTKYVQAKVEATTVLEKVYNYDGETVKKIKHQVSPFITFYNIPWINRDLSHPFQNQLNRKDALFDQFDIVPETNSTNFLRFPQGKSLYYGFSSRIIRRLKRREEEPRAYPFDIVPRKEVKQYEKPQNKKQELQVESAKLWDRYNPHYDDYQEVWNFSVSQAYDFKEYQRLRSSGVTDASKRAFSFLLAKSTVSLDNFSSQLEYKYFWRLVDRENSPPTVLSNKHVLSTSFTWTFANLTNLRRTRSFVRSISGNFTNASQPNPSRTIGGDLRWSFNDFVNIRIGYNYDLLAKNQLSWYTSSIFTHSSECWGLAFRYDWNRNRSPKHGDIGFELLLNLIGTGWLGSEQFEGSNSSGVFGG